MEKSKRKFYNWAMDETSGERELFIDGDIAAEQWFDNDVTPSKFKAELFSGSGNLTLWLNSNGGDVFAASQIYTMLMDYAGEVTVKIYGVAASAASVIAMAGTRVLMSPTALMYVHNPMTIAVGNKSDLQKSIEFLDEVKECILNAYEIKTGLSRAKLSHLMDDETPMNVHKAIALGFCDGVLEANKAAPDTSRHDGVKFNGFETEPEEFGNKTTIKSLAERLNLITGGTNNV